MPHPTFALPDLAGIELLHEALDDLCRFLGASPYQEHPESLAPGDGPLARFLVDTPTADALGMAFSFIKGLFEEERERWEEHFNQLEKHLVECLRKAVIH